MTQTDILRFIDDFLEQNQDFVSTQTLDFALDIRSFVDQLDQTPKLVEAA